MYLGGRTSVTRSCTLLSSSNILDQMWKNTYYQHQSRAVRPLGRGGVSGLDQRKGHELHYAWGHLNTAKKMNSWNGLQMCNSKV